MIAPEYVLLAPVEKPQVVLSSSDALRCLENTCRYCVGLCLREFRLLQDTPPQLRVCDEQKPECGYLAFGCELMLNLANNQAADPQAQISRANLLVPSAYFPKGQGVCKNFSVLGIGPLDPGKISDLQALTR